MIYTQTVEEAAGGSAALPQPHKLHVTEGLIYQFELYFPPGSSGLLHVWIQDGSYQVWPSSTGDTFFGDNTLISFTDRYYIASRDHVLTIYSYNLDTEYCHQYQVRIGQVSEELFVQSFLPGLQIEGFQSMITDVIEAQDYSRVAQRERVVAAVEAEHE